MASATKQEKFKIMTLKNALNYFKNLLFETSKKSDLKVYQEFIRIITSLHGRNLLESDFQFVEAELDALDLNSTTTSNKKYLKDTFSLTTKGYYTNNGMGLGSSFGFVLLSGFERSLGITPGMLIGLITGGNTDAQVKASGKMV